MLPTLLDANGKSLSGWLEKRGIIQIERLSRAPWSRVYRLTASDGPQTVLKVISIPKSESFAIARLLSKHASSSCPQVLEAKPKRGVLHLEDLDNDAPELPQDMTRFAMLGVYGAIQSKMALHIAAFEQQGVPRALATEQLDLFWGLADEPMRPASGSILQHLEAGERNNILARLSQHRSLFLKLAALIDRMPATINHTDLNEGNAHIRADGQMCLLDWDDAIVTAPGWSLHMPFSGPRAVLAAALGEAGANGQFKAALKLYTKALCKSGIYTEDMLTEALPAAACFGVLKYTTDMAPYQLEDAGLRRTVARFALRRLRDLCDTLDHMARPTQGGGALQSQFTDAELIHFPEPKNTGAELKDEVAEAAQLFRENGTVLLRNCVPPPLLHDINHEIERSWQAFEAQIESGSALRVGSGRYMISLPTEGTIGRPDVLAAEKITALCREVLGADAVLGSLTTVVSLPGSPAQRWHCDNNSLFPEEPDLDTPAFSIAVIIPTIKMLPEIGATEIQPRSHREEKPQDGPFPSTIADLDLGDCYLMDSRVMHRGLPNASTVRRPILSLVYQRPWYKDYQNFNNQETLSMSRARLAEYPRADLPLVAWALQKT